MELIAEKEIIAAGFKQYPLNPLNSQRGVNRNWQKTIWIENQKAYFINILEWDFSEYRIKVEDKLAYQAEGQFTLKTKEIFKIELINPITIEEMEKFFDKVFYRLDCEKYSDTDWSFKND